MLSPKTDSGSIPRASLKLGLAQTRLPASVDLEDDVGHVFAERPKLLLAGDQLRLVMMAFDGPRKDLAEQCQERNVFVSPIDLPLTGLEDLEPEHAVVIDQRNREVRLDPASAPGLPGRNRNRAGSAETFGMRQRLALRQQGHRGARPPKGLRGSYRGDRFRGRVIGPVVSLEAGLRPLLLTKISVV